MTEQTLEIRRSSASLWGQKTGMRHLPVVSKYIDTTTCIGCKACEVACQEWNDLETVSTQQVGTYQTMPTLDAEFWNLIRFNEQEFDGGVVWLMRKDQCMHCEDPGCLAACPAPGAIVQYENGIVDVNPEQCIGCGYCETGCPFDVPRFHAKTGKMAKCTLCVDRVSVGLEPACIKHGLAEALRFAAESGPGRRIRRSSRPFGARPIRRCGSRPAKPAAATSSPSTSRRTRGPSRRWTTWCRWGWTSGRKSRATPALRQGWRGSDRGLLAGAAHGRPEGPAEPLR